MIELNPKLCEELDLTYWQLNQEDSTTIHHTISREEKELLRWEKERGTKERKKELQKLEEEVIENRKSIKDKNNIMKYMTVIDDEVDDEDSNSNKVDVMKYMTNIKKKS